MKLSLSVVILSLSRAARAYLDFIDYDHSACSPGTPFESTSYTYCNCMDVCLIPNHVESWYDCTWAWDFDYTCYETDSDSQPSCAANEYYVDHGHTRIDAGLGVCGNRQGVDCNWTKKEYQYECCSCPQGYVSTGTK
jgi:hypothetical protein